MKPTIRKATENDIPELMRLFNTYTAPPKSAAFFQWWNSFPSVTFCAEHGNSIIGMFVVLRRKLMNGLSCGVLMGLIVENEWRGTGLFGEIGHAAMQSCEDMDMFCCLTNATGKRALENHFGFQTIGNIETMVKPYGNSQSGKDSNRSGLDTIGRDTIFPNFMTEWGDQLMFLADEKFRFWRYGVHPRYTYELIQTSHEGYVITNQYYDGENDIHYGDIVDFEFKTLKENEMISALECACQNLGRQADRLTLQAVCGSTLHSTLRKTGFRESGARHFFSVRVMDPRNSYLENAGNWLLKWGDYLR